MTEYDCLLAAFNTPAALIIAFNGYESATRGCLDTGGDF